MSAFRRALSIDPNDGSAHYNIAAIYDAERKYDRAIEEYRIALTLDPTLADPRVNPQVVGNERLLAVKLLLNQEKSGSLGLPLSTLATPPSKKTGPSGGKPGEKR